MFLGFEESIQAPLLQAVNDPFLEALKEEYVEYGDRIPFDKIEHLWTKISMITKKGKVQLKKKEFNKWEQPQVLSVKFKWIDKVQMQLAKWKVKVSEDNIVVHIADQMNESDFFSEETMTKREKLNYFYKTWFRWQIFFVGM